jgi:hypothetical protein
LISLDERRYFVREQSLQLKPSPIRNRSRALTTIRAFLTSKNGSILFAPGRLSSITAWRARFYKVDVGSPDAGIRSKM